MLEAFNKGDTKIVARLLHPDVQSRTKHPLNPEMDRMAVADRVQLEMLHDRKAFPDGRFEVKELIAEENKVILHWTFTGTHTGELFDRQATGRKVSLIGHEIIELDKGRIIRHTDDHALSSRVQLWAARVHRGGLRAGSYTGNGEDCFEQDARPEARS